MTSLNIILIIFLVAVITDIVLWFFKYSSFCNVEDNSISSIQKYPPPQTYKGFSSTFLLLVVVCLISIFVSISYVEISSFVKSYLTETQIQFVKDFIASATNGSGFALFFQTVVSQILLLCGLNLAVCFVVKFNTICKNVIFKLNSIFKKCKPRLLQILYLYLNLQFSRFNQ
ncbi:MAG: hypothetical protein RR248_05985 [Clostridia bacterium]